MCVGRYCPFTFSPRSCIGRNFAMMEARVLLSHFFRKYEVRYCHTCSAASGVSFADCSQCVPRFFVVQVFLAEPTISQEPFARDPMQFLGHNIGTMGPHGGMHVTLRPRNMW
jgi:hypothetical protein